MRRVLTWAGAAAGAIAVLLMLSGLSGGGDVPGAAGVFLALAFILLVASGAAPKPGDRSDGA